MKKEKKNFKILTKEETNQVKGGSWMFNFFSSWSSQASNSFGSGKGNSGGGCPPPEPK